MVVALLCLLAVGLSSCVEEEFAGGAEAKECNSVSVKVQLPKQIVVNPMSRAEAEDFNKVDNLNILISDGTSIKKRIYLDFTSRTGESPFTTEEGVTVTFIEENGCRGYQLDFSDTYWNGSGVSLKDCQFHAVANWGSAITAETDSNDVDELRALETKAGEVDLGNDRVHSVVPTPNVMYGEITDETINESEKKRVVTIGLKRTVAMITLAIDGSGLENNVVIQLDDVTLHNVPSVCKLGLDNKPTVHATQIAKLGDFKGGNMIANGYKLVGEKRFNAMGYTERDGYKTVIGGHYESTENPVTKKSEVTDVSDGLVRPMFLFENMQGTNSTITSETEEKNKRPAGVGGIEEEILKYNETGLCSYIEVHGTYTQYGENNNIARRGPAIWRFFLGGNIYNDFNVKRNTNYQLTLVLSKTGIGEADFSWRVDADLEEPKVVGDADMVVGGGGEMFCVEFIDPDYVNQNMKMNTEGGDFVYAYAMPNNSGKDYTWEQVSSAGKSAWKHYLTAGKQLWFYVSPLLPDDTTTDANERTCTVNFTRTSGEILATVSFTQYRPVTFSITQDDLDHYSDDNDLEEANRIVETYYRHNVLEEGDFVFYADRVDRDPMPWGFSGVTLDKNQNTGFENVYHLIKPLPENTEPNCQNHIDYAAHYLPTGKGFRETGSNYIDYSNGSCMMHAAMENHFQQYAPKPDDTLSPADLLSVTLDQIYRPGSVNDLTPDDKRYSWCVPSIAGCQLVEKLDRFYKRHGITDRGFDPKYPISKWTSYWTSNAATADLKETYPNLDPEIDGKNRSFVYQFDMGLDAIKEGDTYPARLLLPRASSVKYRLLNIRPNNLSAGGTTN